MEILFGILLIIGLVIWVTRGSSSAQNIRSKEADEPSTPKKQPVSSDVFDSNTARRPVEQRVLSGKAYVVDGDTIVIKKTQIRLFGIDAPEFNHPYGKKSKWALHELCKGQTISAKIVEEDAHGRTVALCHLPDGRDLSAEMVKIGLAIDWPKYSNGCYRHLEEPDARKKLYLADARQQGRMHVWTAFEERQKSRHTNG